MATPPKTKRHRGTEAPKCELCGTRHWLRDGHADVALVSLEKRWPFASLQTIDDAKRMLAGTRDLLDIKAIRDVAEAMRHFAKAAGLGLAAQNHAAEVKLRAERRYGDLRIAADKNRGTAGQLKGSTDGGISGGTIMVPPEDQALRRADLGVSKAQDSRWQVESSVPEPVFEEYVASTTEAEKELTSVGLVRIAKEVKRQKKREETRARVAASGLVRDGWKLLPEAVADLDVRADVIITDPPYGEADLPRYSELGALSVRALPDGCSLLVMTGQSYLP